MSSNVYSACLTPDPALRRIVINSARMLIIAGFVLILTMPVPVLPRIAACLAWGVLSLRELRQFHRGYHRYVEIRVAVGNTVKLRNRQHDWVAAELLNGSVLLGSFGWLRLKTVDGHQYAELLHGDRRQSRDWRHLHVIWRHIGANA